MTHQRNEGSTERCRHGVSIDADCVLCAYEAFHDRCATEADRRIVNEYPEVAGELATLRAQLAEREAEVERYRATLEDPAAVHVNILRRTIALTRDQALHIAGATDYDALAAQLAEMTHQREKWERTARDNQRTIDVLYEALGEVTRSTRAEPVTSGEREDVHRKLEAVIALRIWDVTDEKGYLAYRRALEDLHAAILAAAEKERG